MKLLVTGGAGFISKTFKASGLISGACKTCVKYYLKTGFIGDAFKTVNLK